jgi:hypothetical protein
LRAEGYGLQPVHLLTHLPCHPERRWARILRPTESKDLRLLFVSLKGRGFSRATNAIYIFLNQPTRRKPRSNNPFCRTVGGLA